MAPGGAVSDHRHAAQARVLVRSALLGVGLLGVAVAVACGEPEPAPEQAPAAGPGGAVIRLLDHLDEARISSALDGIAPAASLASLEGPLERRETLSTRFETGSVPLVAPCRLAPGAVGPDGRGRVVRCDGGGALALPAQPNRLYELRALLRAAGEHCRTQRPTLVERREGEPIARHPFSEVGTAGWVEYEATYQTRPETQRVDLRFPGGPCSGYVAGIELSEIRLTPSQELAWLAGRSVARGEDPYRQRGRLLPLPDPETAAPPHDDAYSVRDALFAPAPSEIDIPIAVPEQAQLHLGYALSRESRPGDAARLTLEAHSDAGTRVLLDETIAIRNDADLYWRHADLDLRELAGRRTRLVFRATPVSGRGYVLWGAPMIVRARRPEDPPNLVLIAIDTLRADRLSSYGYGAPTSPHIDAFARDAFRFERAISAANWTSPAFHALFTGLSAGEVGARIPRDQVTLAERLRDAGYLTQGIVYKAVLYDRGFDQGFDAYFDVPRVHVRADDALAHALRFLERHGRERFFLFLHLNDPHQPFTQPESHLSDADRARLRDLGLSLPITVKSDRIEGCAACASGGRVNDASRELARALYDDAIRYADEAVGTFLARLREMSLYDDAVIAIVSDHGEGLWQHEEHFAHAGPSLYDELVHVPMLLKPTGAGARGTPRGRTIPTQVRLADLFPTLLALTGLEDSPREPEAAAARSLVGLLGGTPVSDRPALIRGEGSIALRTPDWKYVRRPPQGGRRLREQLFHLASDPEERRDVAGDDPAALARLRGELGRALLAAGARHTLWIDGDPGAQRARLRVRVQHARLLPELSNLPWELADAGHTLRWSGDARQALPAWVQLAPSRDARIEVELWLDAARVLQRVVSLGDATPFPSDPGARSGAPEVRLYLPRHPAATEESATDDETATDAASDARQMKALRALGYIDP